MKPPVRELVSHPAARWLLILATLSALVACAGIHLRLRLMASAVVPLKPSAVAKREGFGVQCKVDKKLEAALASGPGQIWGLSEGEWVRLPQFRQTESKRDVVERMDHAWRPLGRNVWIGGRKAAPFHRESEYEIVVYSRRRTVIWHLAALTGGFVLGFGRLRRVVETSTLPARATAWLEAS